VTRVIDLAFRVFEAAIVACLVAMVVMVFGNAALRKLADFDVVLMGGGIDISEELSRIMFVWLTFIGAVVVARENAHLGVDALVARFGDTGRKVAMVASDAFTVLCCAVFFWGTWRQAGLHMSNTAPITGMSMIWVYGVGFFASVGMGALAVARILRTLTGRLDPVELKQFAGEYDAEPGSLKSKAE
jgi:TRAP-type transport system small permease protein